MAKKLKAAALLIWFFGVLSGCANVFRPMYEASVQHPDRILFEKAAKSAQNQRYQEARTLLETLINTYPESGYVGRATAMLDNMWYAGGGVGPRTETPPEGGQTFFPSLQETPVVKPEIKKSGQSLQN
jgi:hypothetical protein